MKKYVFFSLSGACGIRDCAIWEITLSLLLELHLKGQSKSLWFCVS